MRLLSCVMSLLVIAAGPAWAATMEGRAAPAMSLTDAAGEPRTLAEVAAGRPAIVLFWASWCPYCKALMKPLTELVSEYGNERIVVVAVNVWEDDEAAAREIIARGHPFSFLMGGGKQAKKWGVKGTPGLFVLDREGRIVYDRAARPLKAAADAPADAQVRRETPEQACMRWLTDVRDVLAAALAPAPG